MAKKTDSERQRPRLGDILELGTPRGLAYLQYVNSHPQWGGLLRVLPGLFDQRPNSFEHLVQQHERFLTFLPVGPAVRRKILRIAATAPIPERLRAFPLFRSPGNIDPVTHKVTDWWLWDGQRSWYVGQLTPEQRSLPIKEVVNDTMLIQWIVTNASPGDDLE